SVGEGSKDQHQNKRRHVGACADWRHSRATGRRPELAAWYLGDNADIVLRAGMDAIQAESAIHVARLLRLEQSEFASRDSVPAADTILRSARRADLGIDDAYFKRRNQRLHKVELTNRAEVFAKDRAAKKTVDHKRQSEVSHRKPCGPPR